LLGLQPGYIARMSGASAAGDSAAEGGGRAAEVWFTVPQPEEPPPETVVRLEIPAQTRVVRAARLVASGLASTAGFDVDDVDDMRIAIDELCAVMFELGAGGVVSITFATRPGEIEVHGQTTASDGEVDPTRIGLSLQILHAACDEFSWTVADGVARVRIEKRLRRQDLPGGAVVRRFPAGSSVRRPRPS
jgi:anti-sigma regulatory factor (Ser/Thr protein kinase)